MTATTRPILPSADLVATAEFYRPLGFSLVGHWPGEYLIIAGPDTIELHFWSDPDVDRWTNDVACWIGYPGPAGVRALHARWSAVGVAEPATLRPVTDDGRLTEFQLIDQFGNLLRVGALSNGS